MHEDASENGGEDEIVHHSSQGDRILRGQILPSSDPDFVRLRRRDGEWLVAKAAIITIRRAFERVAGTLIETVKATDPTPEMRVRAAISERPDASDYEVSKITGSPVQLIQRVRRENREGWRDR